MEIERSIDMPWAFTYKVLGPCENDSVYNIVKKVLKSYGMIKHCVLENDSQGKPHIHGIVLLRKGFFRQRLKVQGFHCCLREIYDEQDWLRYCNKDQPNSPLIDNKIYML